MTNENLWGHESGRKEGDGEGEREREVERERVEWKTVI